MVAGLGIMALAASPVMAKGQRSDAGKHLDFLDRKLKLSDEQRGQVERILNDYHNRTQSLKEQFESLRSEKQKRIQAVLTPEQQAKFEKMKQKQHGKGGWHRRKRSTDD